jgi:class 3 adenylate cyclase
LVVWPENGKNDLTESCRRAVQCALDIQSKLNEREICPGRTLSVKIGVGVGEVRILFVGGQFSRCEYLIVGESMRQACEAETKATDGGQTICSEDVYRYIEKYYQMEEAYGDDSHGPSESNMKFYKILKLVGDRVAIKADAYLMRSHFSSEKLREKISSLKQFVPAAITIYLEIEKELWSKEIRMLTIMFLNLKVDLSQTKNEQGMNRIQDIVRTVQRSVYRTKGSLNKFLMDDKGSVMLIVWGLPPYSNPDDPVRSVQSALSLVKELKKYNCGAYMGITTGSCFSGVCGTHGGRREYSLLGEIVNLSARHMQQAIYHAKKLNEEKKTKQDYVILICEKTKDVYICSLSLYKIKFLAIM